MADPIDIGAEKDALLEGVTLALMRLYSPRKQRVLERPCEADGDARAAGWVFWIRIML